MPWNAKQSGKFKKGLSPAQQKKWATVANAVLKKTGDDGSAVRIANSQTKVRKRPKGR